MPSHRRPARRRRLSIRPRSHLRRQAAFVALALAGVIGGYAIARLARHEPPSSYAVDLASGPRGGTGGGATAERGIAPDAFAAVEDRLLRVDEEAVPEEVHEGPGPPGPDPAAGDPGPVAMLPRLPAEVAGEDAVVLPAWRRHAVPAPAADGAPMVAVVIDDLGVDRRRTLWAIALPGPLTLAFLAYAEDLPEQTAIARAAGHELLVHAGMEPLDRDADAGPNALAADLDAAELRRRLDWMLTRFDGYVGINNHMGSRFTADHQGMGLVMQELRRRGLLFLDSRTTAASVGAELAVRFGVPVAERNVFLDHAGDGEAVEARLADVERIARRHGHAIAIGHPRDITLEVLDRWLEGHAERGLRLVPLSTIVARRLERQHP